MSKLTTSATIGNFLAAPSANLAKEAIQANPITVTAGTVAADPDNYYVVSGTVSFSDPTVPSGNGYCVFVRSGTATLGGQTFTPGALIYRFWDGVFWLNSVYASTNSTNFTAFQTFIQSPTSANLALLLTDESGTGGGFVRANGATLTSPSLVGPVNLTGQDATTADRVMTRGLADARYSRFIDDVAILRLPPNNFTSTTPVSGSASATFGSARGCFLSLTATNNARVWVNHFPGLALNTQNISNNGFNAQNPFTIIIPVASINIGASTRAWLRFGAPSAFMQDYSTVEPSGSDAPSIGWVATRQTTSELDMRLYTWNGTTLNYSPVVTATDAISNNPRFIVLSGNGTNLRLRVVNRLRQVVLDTSIPTIPLTAWAIGSLGLINNGTAQTGDLSIVGGITVLPYEIQI